MWTEATDIQRVLSDVVECSRFYPSPGGFVVQTAGSINRCRQFIAPSRRCTLCFSISFLLSVGTIPVHRRMFLVLFIIGIQFIIYDLTDVLKNVYCKLLKCMLTSFFAFILKHATYIFFVAIFQYMKFTRFSCSCRRLTLFLQSTIRAVPNRR